MRCRFCCCTAFPMIRAASMRSSPSSMPRASAPSSRICAAMAARGSCPAETLRSGEQAALGQDLLELLDALHIEKAVLAGYDWGGRAACVVSALWPERAAGLVSCTGYNIQDIPNSCKPADPEAEARLWYQYYFHTERGRSGLTQKRREICRLLWKMWSPTWAFDDATFERTAASFDNEDFRRCRHPFLSASLRQRRRRSRYAPVEARLAAQPKIGVPTINLHGAADGVMPAVFVGNAREIFHRPVSTPRGAECRPQRAAGIAASFCRGGAGALQECRRLVSRDAVQLFSPA